jgi:hypothetical protein
MGGIEFAGADFSRMPIEPAHAHLARINFKALSAIRPGKAPLY